MIYDLSQLQYNGAPQLPGQSPNSTEYQQFAVGGKATVMPEAA